MDQGGRGFAGEDTLIQSIGKVELARLLPGDILVVTMRENAVGLSAQQAQRAYDLLRRALPTWAKLIVLSGCDVKVVRPADGGAETEADGAEGIAGQSGQTGAE